MAKNFIQPGESIRITGQTADRSSGWLFRRIGTGANALAKGWIGVIEDDITGTSSNEVTIGQKPILIGDGVAAEAQSGDGIGDMTLEGVFVFALPASGMVVQDTDPLYMQVADVTAPGTVASGVTNNQDAAFNKHAISGALVGFAVGTNYTATTAPFTGLNVVDVKLLGLPLHGLANSGPAANFNDV